MHLKVINKNEELQEFVKTVNLISSEITDKLRETNIFIDEYLNSHQEIIPEMGNYFFSSRGKQLRPLLCLYSSKMINENYYHEEEYAKYDFKEYNKIIGAHHLSNHKNLFTFDICKEEFIK